MNAEIEKLEVKEILDENRLHIHRIYQLTLLNLLFNSLALLLILTSS